MSLAVVAGMKKTMNDQAEPTKSNTKKKLYKKNWFDTIAKYETYVNRHMKATNTTFP